MKEIVWDESYEIGVEEIDRQHMDFVKLLRRFNIGGHAPNNLPLQLRILQEMLKYAKYHFCSEENIMFFTKYPALAIQEKEHAELLRSLLRSIDKYRLGRLNGEALSEFLYDWFINHTQTEDRKIAAHIAQLKKDAGS